MFRDMHNGEDVARGDLTCKEFVELVTDYLEGTLDQRSRARFEEHLVDCPGCPVYLRQMEEIVGAVGMLREEDVSQVVRDELMSRFRGWKVYD